MPSVTSASSAASSAGPKPPPKEKVLLRGVEETLLAGVWCRARDAASEQPLLGDPYARPTLDRCDVDYARTTFASVRDERWARFIGGRSRALDAWCQAFLDGHAARGEAVQVVHAGCGLDSRVLRVARGPGVRWVDLDRPMVVHLRERLFVGDWDPRARGPGVRDGDQDGGGVVDGGDGGSGSGEYVTRSLSVTHPSWVRDILQDRKTLVVAEGLLMYLEPDEARQVIRDVVEYFGEVGGGKGGEIIFDTMGTILRKKTDQVEWLEDSGVKISWGVDDAKEVEALHPNLKLIETRPWHEFMSTERRVSCSPPWFGPLKTKVAALNSSFMDFAQVMRFEF